MKAPSGGWVKRDGETLTVGCDNTDNKYHLVCRENEWVGSYKNCTNGKCHKYRRSWVLSPTGGNFLFNLFRSSLGKPLMATLPT